MIELALAVSAAATLQVLQSVTPVEGRRVRLVTHTDSTLPVVGMLAGSGEFLSVQVTKAGTTVLIHRADVARLSVSLGSNIGVAGRNGLLVGLGVGAILFAATIDEAEDFEVPLAFLLSFAVVPLPFALSGVLLARERWEGASMPSVLSSSASAGPSIRFGPGEHVRATTSSGMRRGIAAASTPDSLILSDGTRLPWRDVSSVSVRAGRSRAAGGLVGGLIGLGIGIAAVAGSPSPDASANAGGIVLTTAGGAILGSRFLPFSKWMSLPMSR